MKWSFWEQVSVSVSTGVCLYTMRKCVFRLMEVDSLSDFSVQQSNKWCRLNNSALDTEADLAFICMCVWAPVLQERHKQNACIMLWEQEVRRNAPGGEEDKKGKEMEGE